MGQVVKLPNMKAYEEVFEDVLNGLRDDSVRECAIIARRKLEDGSYEIRRWWCGDDSCINVLGLLQYMTGLINDFIRENDG